MEKSQSIKAKETLALGKGLNLLFWGGIFIAVDFIINDFDILPDLIGYLFAIAGVLYLINGSVLLETTGKVFTWIAAITVFLSFVAYIIEFLIKNLTHPLWIVFVSILFPIFLLSIAYVGYSISKKLVQNMEKRWRNLLFIYIVISLILFAIPVAFTVALPEILKDGTSFQSSVNLHPMLFIILVFILPLILVVYSFFTIRKTSKQLKNSVK
ncbi:hypothetical protein C0416_01860 [bacterium]|nr:hypothetical protein [bacterium]